MLKIFSILILFKLICFNRIKCELKTENVKFKNKNANITLHGTLSYFKNSTRCVILAHPYFPHEQFRSNEIMKSLADNLSNYNLTVLAFDERGTGKSEGNFNEARANDFVDDILIGIDYMKTRKELKQCKYGIIGYSKGGVTAMLAANKSKNVEFIVLLATPTINIVKLSLKQIESMLNASNISMIESKKYIDFINISMALIKNNNLNELQIKLYNISYEFFNDTDINLETFILPWFKDFILINHHDLLIHIKIPVLGLYGSVDKNINPDENMNSLNYSLRAANNKNFKIIKLENVNHYFQVSTNENVTNDRIAILALDEISNWINNEVVKQ